MVARGAIITALVAIGAYPDYPAAVEALVKVERSYEPNLENHQVYRAMFDLYRDVRGHLMDDWDHRASIVARGASARGM